MSDYFVLRLRNVDDRAEDWLSAESFAHGALGMSEALAFNQPEGEEDVFTLRSATRAVEIYFQAVPGEPFLNELRARFPEVQWKIDPEANRDWLEEWKKGFVPFRLVGDHWVVPSWCTPPAEAEHKIWIEPGMAFGTGTHETTQLMAEALADVASGATTVLDVGTGTGILAVLARQLGIARVVATEIEADSRRVAREVFRANQCEDIEMDDTQVEGLNQTFDVVMANIIDGVLVRLQDDLLKRVKPGGWILLSGIIGEREPDFVAGFKIKAWDVRREKGDWRLFGARINSCP